MNRSAVQQWATVAEKELPEFMRNLVVYEGAPSIVLGVRLAGPVIATSAFQPLAFQMPMLAPPLSARRLIT